MTTQMTDHVLDPKQGWPNISGLARRFPAANADDVFYNGMVCSLTNVSPAVIRPGLLENAVPLFAFENPIAYGLGSEAGNTIGTLPNQFYGQSGNYGHPSKVTSGAQGVVVLVGLDTLELESTEFDADQTYTPNLPLTSPSHGVANAGRLEPGAYGTDTICGIVSDGAQTNHFRKSVLRFWAHFQPVVA